MDETLFEYRYEQDDEYIKDILNYSYFKKPVRIVLYVLCFLFVCLNAFFTIRSFIMDYPTSYKVMYVIVTIVTALLLLYILFFGYNASFRIAKKRKAELFGDKPVVTEAYVTEDVIRLVNSSNHAENEIKLSSVVKAYDNRSILILKTKAYITVTLSKKGFVKGTYEEFLQFLFSKGVKCIK